MQMNHGGHAANRKLRDIVRVLDIDSAIADIADTCIT